MTEARATETCNSNHYNFSDPDVVSFFVRGPWYNNANQSTIMDYSGMTDAEYWSFYNVNNTNPYAFGSYLNIEMKQIVELYNCPNAIDGNVNFTSNCSSWYLAHAQWGQSLITMNPPVLNSTMFPYSLTLKDWDYMGLDRQYEYYFWSDLYNDLTGETAPELSAWQVGNMTGKAYSHYGLKETYNGKMLYMARTIFGYDDYLQATL